MLVALRRYSIALLLSACSLQTYADVRELQDNLLAQELSTYRLLTLFHLLRLEQGAPEVHQRLTQEVQHFALLRAAQGPLAAEQLSPALVSQLATQAQAFEQLLLRNAGLDLEQLDFYALNDLSQSAHGLAQLNRQQQAELAEAAPAADVQQAVLMQRIAAEYVREAASWDAGSAVYDSAQALSEPVDVMAQRFAQQLEQLQQEPTVASAEQARLAQVRVVWNFIEQPLRNYRERSLPFVVSRYSEQIVTLLLN
jgi:hypothetical protein